MIIALEYFIYFRAFYFLTVNTCYLFTLNFCSGFFIMQEISEGDVDGKEEGIWQNR